MTQNVLTVFSEFLSRGLLWLRVLALGAIIPPNSYGIILVYLGIEGLLAATASYPIIKDILVRQDLKPILYLRFMLFFLLLAAPAAVAMVHFGDLSSSIAIVLIFAAFLNGLSQIALYVLRVADVRAHNRAKIFSSLLTTLFFLVLLPLSWLWLPVVYLLGGLVVLFAAHHSARISNATSAQEANVLHHLRGCLIFGSQALLLSMPQHGMRLVVAANMTLADVALYTQVYMLGTALFFAYSAIMISVEAELSRAAPSSQIRERFGKAGLTACLLIASSIVYFGTLIIIDKLGIIDSIIGFSIQGNLTLLAVFIVFTSLSGLRVIANALTLAASRRLISLLASIAGALTLGFSLFNLIQTRGLAGVGLSLVFGQAVEFAFLSVYVFFATRARTLSRIS